MQREYISSSVIGWRLKSMCWCSYWSSMAQSALTLVVRKLFGTKVPFHPINGRRRDRTCNRP